MMPSGRPSTTSIVSTHLLRVGIMANGVVIEDEILNDESAAGLQSLRNLRKTGEVVFRRLLMGQVAVDRKKSYCEEPKSVE